MATPDPGSLLEEVAAELVSYCESRADYGLLQFGSLIGAHQYFRLYRVLLRHTPRGSKVLDWGCGNGHFSYALVRLGYKAVGFSGYDSPSHHLREVLSPTGYEFYEMAADEPRALPFPDESFEVVASVGVLEHVRETSGSEVGSLREICRVLKPGGRLICYHFPTRFSLIQFLAMLVPGKHHHRFRHTRRVIEDLCRQAGLKVVEIQRYAFLPRNTCRLLPRFLRNSKAAARAWDALDGALSVPFRGLCQYYCFVATKTCTGRASQSGEAQLA